MAVGAAVSVALVLVALVAIGVPVQRWRAWRRIATEAAREIELLKHDVTVARADRDAAQRLADLAQPTYDAANAARLAAMEWDGKFTVLVQNLRQHIYRQKLMLEQFLPFLPPTERVRATELISSPPPKIEDIQ